MPVRLASAVLIATFVVIVGALAISLHKLTASGDVANVVLGVVAGIATVSVAFFSVHISDGARRDAEAARDRAQKRHEFEQNRVARLGVAANAEERAAIVNETPPEALPRTGKDGVSADPTRPPRASDGSG